MHLHRIRRWLARATLNLAVRVMLFRLVRS